MPYIITEACINTKDRACVDVCPVDCIYEGPDQLYIHPDECIDCGACEPECPWRVKSSRTWCHQTATAGARLLAAAR